MYKFITEARKYFYVKLLNNSIQHNLVQLYLFKVKYPTLEQFCCTITFRKSIIIQACLI